MDDVKETGAVNKIPRKPNLIKPSNNDELSPAHQDGKLQEPDSKQCLHGDNQQSTGDPAFLRSEYDEFLKVSDGTHFVTACKHSLDTDSYFGDNQILVSNNN